MGRERGRSDKKRFATTHHPTENECNRSVTSTPRHFVTLLKGGRCFFRFLFSSSFISLFLNCFLPFSLNSHSNNSNTAITTTLELGPSKEDHRIQSHPFRLCNPPTHQIITMEALDQLTADQKGILENYLVRQTLSLRHRNARPYDKHPLQ